MQGHLNKNELAILRAVRAAGGQYTSLFRLAIDMNKNYETVWLTVLKLACRGLIEAQRKNGRGRAYKITLGEWK